MNCEECENENELAYSEYKAAQEKRQRIMRAVHEELDSFVRKITNGDDEYYEVCDAIYIAISTYTNEKMEETLRGRRNA